MKRFVFIIVMVLIVFFNHNNSKAQFDYSLKFYQYPVATIYEGQPAMKFFVNFGGYLYKPCSYCYCITPPLEFIVEVLWQDPNDPGGDPNCWIPVFQVLAHYDRGGELFAFPEKQADGIINLLNPNPDETDRCCYYKINCEGNTWEIYVWPLTSGTYKINLYKGVFPQFHFCYFCCDLWWPFKSCPWGPGVWKLADKRSIDIKSQANDFVVFSELYFITPDNSDTLYSGSTLRIFDEYDVVCKILTNHDPHLIPPRLVGYLEPEDQTPTQITLERWPEGDNVLPCNQNYPMRGYGYRFSNGFKPANLYPGIPPEQWMNTTKYLDCALYGQHNNIDKNISIRGTLMSGLQLDRRNDTTMCFIPAKQEEMDFVFRYSPYIGLDSDSDIRFRVWNSSEELVYERPVQIQDSGYEPGGPDFPGLPDPDSTWIFWDGRINRGANEGHLASPYLDPYTAKVQVFENDEPLMETNAEEFNVVPWIDSVLVTHDYWFPPVNHGWFTDLYSLTRGKIDDSGAHENDYELYIPEGAEYPYNLTVWDGHSTVFRDAEPNNSPVSYYENLQQEFSALRWDDSHWGQLSYKWFAVKDTVNVADKYNIQYFDVDTTQSWGSEWSVTINNEVDWRVYSGLPYMRLLVKSGITNTYGNYGIQQKSSAGEQNAHKIIFTSGYSTIQDLLFWAVSYIGVPYFSKLYVPKVPYTKIDCSGLITAARIQDIGVENNQHFRINYISANDYVNGTYKYPDANGIDVTTETSQIEPSIATKNDIVGIKLPNSTIYRHIAIVEQIIYDDETEEIRRCMIVHAWGKSRAEQRRVRYDNLLAEFPGWTYAFLRFSDN